jgi:hypothetical protein
MVRGTFDGAALQCAARAARRTSPSYYRTLATRQPPCRKRLAMRLFEEAVRLAPNDGHVLAVLVRRLMDDDELARAIALCDGAPPRARGALPLVNLHWRALQLAGDLAQALAVAQECLALNPDDAHMQRSVHRLEEKIAAQAKKAQTPRARRRRAADPDRDIGG